MKQGWQIKDFELCLDKTKTTTKLKSSLYGEQGAFPIVSQEKELISGYWDKEEDVFKHKTPIVVFGDHTKVVKYIDFDFVIGADGVKILSPKPFLNPKYFYYWVCSVQIPSHGYARHYRYLKEHQVPVPNLSEQQRIVALLDAGFAKIDALKANAEKNLQNAKDLFQAALKKELEPKEGWKSMLLGDFAKMKAGDFIKASDIHSDYYEGSFPCYGGNGLRGYVDVPNKEGEYCLIGRQGALCGNVHIANGVFRATEHAVVVEPYFSMPIKLVYYLLTALNLNKYSTGAAQPGLSVKNIAEKAMISIPPEEKYSIITATLDGLSVRTQALQVNYEKTLSLCDDLKQALLRKAFNGEI